MGLTCVTCHTNLFDSKLLIFKKCYKKHKNHNCFKQIIQPYTHTHTQFFLYRYGNGHVYFKNWQNHSYVVIQWDIKNGILKKIFNKKSIISDSKGIPGTKCLLLL